MSSSPALRNQAEITRYSLYSLCFIFGVLFWCTTSNKLTFSSCVLFSEIVSEHLIEFSALCNVFSAIGIVLTIVLLVLAVWHAMIHFSKPFLPYHLEGIIFTIISLTWLLVAVITVVRSNPKVRLVDDEVRYAIASAFVACFLHAAVSVLAFWQSCTSRSFSSDGQNKPQRSPQTVIQIGP